MNNEMLQQMRSGKGFIAALDQSGGSTPKALSLYGLDSSAYSNEAEMFDRMHEMRSRLIKSPAFNGNRVIGAILFEMTMERTIDGIGTAEYLWSKKHVVPFLKVDNGLADEANDVQLMKPIPELGARIAAANKHGVFGTKMRSVINLANQSGIDAVVKQQFEIGPQKAEAEALLKKSLLDYANALSGDQNIMLKLSIPTVPNLYKELVDHPRVVRVVALSGGYSRDEANKHLAENTGVIASFSRALVEGLTAQQSDAEFDKALDASIQSIYDASIK
ncbi:MAG: class I fructose-bisphosphate aldolase [Actinobacteria bacterium]|nr:class I fructose-bisphosphate aldolase [Actinomycetota bacterium]